MIICPFHLHRQMQNMFCPECHEWRNPFQSLEQDLDIRKQRLQIAQLELDSLAIRANPKYHKIWYTTGDTFEILEK
jgi:hypothetical protein